MGAPTGRGRGYGGRNLHWRRREDLPIGAGVAGCRENLEERATTGAAIGAGADVSGGVVLVSRTDCSQSEESWSRARVLVDKQPSAPTMATCAAGISPVQEIGDAKEDGCNSWPPLSISQCCMSSSSCSGAELGLVQSQGGSSKEANGIHDEHSRLLQDFRSAEQRESQHAVVMASLQAEVHCLRCDAATALERASRLHCEATNIRAHAGGSNHEDAALHSRQADLIRRAEELSNLSVAHQSREREWQDELDSMARGSSAVEPEVATLRRDIGRWRRAATEQAQRVSRAEARLKILTQRRAELRMRRDHLQLRVAEQCDAEDRSIITLRDLRVKLRDATPAGVQQRRGWQTIVALLLLLVLWLWLAW